MKKIILPVVILCIVAIGFTSCRKESMIQSNIDHDRIVNYVKSHDLKGQYTNSGIFYAISDTGSVQHPTDSSTITVDYKGYLLDGTVFDQQTNFTDPLYDLIKGWQQGIPLIGTGGTIKLIIPSALGYGTSGSGSVPGNAVLVFDITLDSFTN